MVAECRDEPLACHGRQTCLLQRCRHGHHGGYEHYALPVDSLVCRPDTAQAACHDHQQRRHHDSRHGCHIVSPEDHGGDHGHHYADSHRRLVVKDDLLSHLARLAEKHPPRGAVAAHGGDIIPCPLHEECVASPQPLVGETLLWHLLMASQGEDTDPVALPEARVSQPLPHKA